MNEDEDGRDEEKRQRNTEVSCLCGLPSPSAIGDRRVASCEQLRSERSEWSARRLSAVGSEALDGRRTPHSALRTPHDSRLTTHESVLHSLHDIKFQFNYEGGGFLYSILENKNPALFQCPFGATLVWETYSISNAKEVTL